MSDISVFESRKGSITCTSQELYSFLTDIRNLSRFIPEGSFSDIVIDKDSCSFNVSMMGKVNIRISNKEEYSEVIYSGSALHVNEFSLAVKFHDTGADHAEAFIVVSAILNPMLKMIASEPIDKFLETLISEMERFRGWNEIREDTQTP